MNTNSKGSKHTALVGCIYMTFVLAFVTAMRPSYPQDPTLMALSNFIIVFEGCIFATTLVKYHAELMKE